MISAECAAAKREVREAKFSFQSLGKAQAIGETYGWAKIIGDAKTGEVLGVHIIGPQASTMIAEAGLAMQPQSSCPFDAPGTPGGAAQVPQSYNDQQQT